MLASEYADTDSLYELPTCDVLASERQAPRVAAALTTLLREQPGVCAAAWAGCG